MGSCTWRHKTSWIRSLNRKRDVSDTFVPIHIAILHNWFQFGIIHDLARLKRRTLTLDDINKIKDATPPLKKGSAQMFRNLRDKGIISYTEYLFLLSILTSKFLINFWTQISNTNFIDNNFFQSAIFQNQNLDLKSHSTCLIPMATNGSIKTNF